MILVIEFEHFVIRIGLCKLNLKQSGNHLVWPNVKVEHWKSQIWCVNSVTKFSRKNVFDLDSEWIFEQPMVWLLAHYDTIVVEWSVNIQRTWTVHASCGRKTIKSIADWNEINFLCNSLVDSKWRQFSYLRGKSG